MSSLAPQTERSRTTSPPRRRAGRAASAAAPRRAPTSPKVPRAGDGSWLRAVKAAALVGVAAGSAFGVVKVRELVEASDAVSVQQIRVVGVDVDSPRVAELRAYADVALGTPLFAVDTDVVAARVARHPFIATAEVRRALPDAVEIVITERTPRALLRVGDGAYLIDEHGEVMKRARPGDVLDLPLLALLPAADGTAVALDATVETPDAIGADAADEIATAALPPRVAEALAIVAAADAAGLGARLSEVIELPAVGFELVLDDGARARLGNDLFDDKLRRLLATEERLRASGRRFSFMYLDDARHPERVAVRLRSATETTPAGG